MKQLARAGFTALEAVVSLAIFGTALLAFSTSLTATNETMELTATEDRLNRSGLKALAKIRKDLRRTGFETNFPKVFNGDNIATEFPAFGHLTALDSNGAVVQNCDLVFRQPADADSDGWPDIVGNEVYWEAQPTALTLMPDSDGTNRLVRTDAAGRVQVVARGIDQIAFESASMTGFAIPLDSMRVTLQLRGEFASGQTTTADFSMVVRLMNGGLEL